MAGAGFLDFTAGNVLTADQLDQYLMQQSIMRFPSVAARNAALAAVVAEGMVCYVTATDRFYVYDGTNWIVFGWGSPAGRVGCAVRRVAAQAVNTATPTNILWDTEDSDSDGFITPTSATITVPAGMDGVYSIFVYAITPGSWGQNNSDRFVLTAPVGNSYNLPASVGASGHGDNGGGITIPLAAGNTLTVSVTQNSGGVLNFTGILFMYRVCP